MEKGSGVSYVRIEPLTNGALVCYDKKIKNKGGGTFDGYSYKSEKEAYVSSETMSKEEAVEKALDRFESLWKQEHGMSSADKD